jgi:hypothetical protein
VESNCIIPIHEIVKSIEPKPVMFVSIVPFFQFSIGLRMLDASFDVFDFILLKKVLKSAIRIAVLVSLVCIELGPSIGQNLSNTCQPPNLPIASLRSCKALSVVSASNSPPARIRRELSSRTTQTNTFFAS